MIANASRVFAGHWALSHMILIMAHKVGILRAPFTDKERGVECFSL